MARWPVERVWRTVLTVVALAATVAALYLQVFERRARQTEDSDRALRRDLEELRAATLRESDIAVKTIYLMLVALAALVGQFLLGYVHPQ